jgi:serine/threonine-protein kinase HipA
MMTLARQIGMDIPDVALKPVKDIVGLPAHIPLSDAHALMIKRFDRGPDGQRIHIEDFAQVFNAYPKDKYTRASYRNIAHVLSRETELNDMAEFIRRLVFNTLIGNADMHLKNWSLIYPDGKTPQLAPGYDFVSTIAYLPDNKMALNYVRVKSMFDLSLDLLSHFASKAGLPETLVMNTAKETVRRFQTQWKAEKAHLPLSKWVINGIEKHMRQIPLVSEV